MFHYSKYIIRHLVYSTLLITFSLTSIIWLTQALRFIDFIVNQGVSIVVFLQLTMLLLPSLILMVLPPALFCAIVFTYHKLKVDSELIVLQAAGLNKWRIGIPAMQVGICVTLIAYAIALFVQPLSYGRFKDMQSFLRNNYVSLLLQEGVFSNPVNGLTVFIRERSQDGILQGILVHDNRIQDSPVTMMAEQAKLVETSEGPRFLLTNGNRQEIHNGKLSFLMFKDYEMDISLYTQSLNKRPADAQELPVSQLLRADPTLSDAENRKRFAEGTQRLLWPGYPLCLALMALAVMLSGEFNRRGHWQRVALSVALCVVLLFSAVGFRGLMAAYPFMALVAYLNLIVPMLISAAILLDYKIPLFSKDNPKDDFLETFS